MSAFPSGNHSVRFAVHRTVFSDRRRVTGHRPFGGQRRENLTSLLGCGRPTIPADKEAIVRDLLASGTGIVKTARLAGVGVSAVQRIKAAMPAAIYEGGGEKCPTPGSVEVAVSGDGSRRKRRF